MEQLNRFIWTYLFLPCLLLCGLLLTLRCGVPQVRRFGLMLHCTIGGSRRGETEGEISPLQAASTALAATVGTGNIIGTAQAIAMGGRGAVFWMWAAAFLGMAVKYGEILLGVKYRVRRQDGTPSGGPMYYIERGLGPRFAPLGAVYAAFAALSVLSMGNMSQINGCVSAIADAVDGFTPLSAETGFRLRLCLGLFLAVITAVILAGDARRVGRVTELLVPFMSAAFLFFTSTVILCHAQKLLPVLRGIVHDAFSPRAALGAAGGLGMKEAMHWGIRRSAFSNEAGLGTAAIAHAAAKADDPARHALWGIFEVFADTIVISSATALAILCSGVEIPWGAAPGPELLQAALATVFGPKCAALFMALSLSLFGFSTVVGCSLYGVRCVQYLFGESSGGLYRLAYAACVVVGSVMSTTTIWSAADTINALMSVPNFIALFAFSGLIGRESRKIAMPPTQSLDGAG